MSEIQYDVPQQMKYDIKQTEESEERTIIRQNYKFFGGLSILYAIFYTFCTYKNDAGITIPLLEVGTISYYVLIVKKLLKQVKKGSLFYIAAIFLLGFSIFLTDDWKITMMSKLAIIILLVVFVLHQFYDDFKWTFLKYFEVFSIVFIETIAAIIYPFTDAVNAIKIKERQRKENEKLKYILIGIGVALPVTFVIMVLLLSADLIFASIFTNIFTNLTTPLLQFKNLFSILTTMVFSYVVVYCFVNAVAKKYIKEEVIDRRILDPTIANTFTGIISAIYIIFCGIQILGLFGANLKLPEGYTYSQYAREGFFQLLLVCGINLLIVLCCMAFFRESNVLKVLLTIISICTYIMIASSAYRMILYIQAYQLTFLRIFVLWSLFVIALFMIGIMIQIYRKTFPLFRYCMVIATVCLIGLAYSHPDYIIASYNMKAMTSMNEQEAMKEIYVQYGDLEYIATLSADAAKAMATYEGNDEIVNEYFENIKSKSEQLNLRTFNISRFMAGNTALVYLNQQKKE